MMLRLEKGVTTQQNVIYIECQKNLVIVLSILVLI